MSHKGTDASILVDEFVFDANTSALQVDISVAENDATNLASSAQEFLAALPNMAITQNGYFDGVNADGFEAELRARLGVGGVVVSALFGTNDVDCPAYCDPDAFNTSIEIAAPVAGLMTLNGAWTNSDNPYRGVRVASAENDIKATGALTAYDLGSAGSDGGLFILHVHEITGAASGATFVLQSSDAQAGVYADEGKITVSGEGAQTVALTGTVGRWVRLNCTGLGGASKFSVTAIAAVRGVTM